jgi:hypothetical protein
MAKKIKKSTKPKSTPKGGTQPKSTPEPTPLDSALNIDNVVTPGDTK